MILLSNHLINLKQFNSLSDITLRINRAHIKTLQELERLVSVPYDIFLDYPKGRSKPPKPVLHMPDAIELMQKNKNIKHFAVSNIETSSEVGMITSALPEHVSFVPKIETWQGVVNLDNILKNNPIKHIMLDAEDLYTSVNNDQELFLYLKDRTRKTCSDNNVIALELYGVVFNG